MENEIKVGEYVRTDNGEIHKVEDIEDLRIHIETEKIMFRNWVEDYYGCHKEVRFIVKHSSNIIDIIEERRLCKWKKSYYGFRKK